jgi:hypothetical protein
MLRMKIERRKTGCLPVDITHGVEEEGGAIPRVNDNTVDAYMPILVGGVELIDVPPPSTEAMIAFLDKKHFLHKRSEVRVVAQPFFKISVGLLPCWRPRSFDILCDEKVLVKVVVWRDVHSSVPITIAHHKFILEACDIHLIDGPDKRKTS